MKIIFATHNSGKVKEMKAILKNPNIEILSSEEIGIAEDVVEDGKTFEENAFKKARFVAERSREWAVADDSGLCIEILDNAPGVFSARWAGEGASDEEIVRYTLHKIKNVSEEKRKAFFQTAVALVGSNGQKEVFVGRVFGKITSEPRGNPRSKLPYDVIFIPDGFNQTFAEMSNEQKNSLSHRGLAFQKLKEFLIKNLIKK